MYDALKLGDIAIFNLIKQEEARQDKSIELIASENFVSEAVLDALGSILTNKYTEGYPGRRYYGGCTYYDEIETLCQNRWLSVFNCANSYSVNVQPHSGSQANFAAYKIALNPGDTFLGFSLEAGGHLTHGSSVNFSGQLYHAEHYGVNSDGFIDMDNVREIALRVKPKLIVCGASAYPRKVEFDKFAAIAKEVGALLMADISHIAGLVATGFHMSPFGFADIITTTTHKTLRGPRGALIFCKKELEKKMNSAVFPYAQGGSLQNVIAAKAVAANECLGADYTKYIFDVLKNTSTMCSRLASLGYEAVTGGTDNHLFVIDFSKTHPNLSGKMVQDLLDKYNITVNKESVPGDLRGPSETSGVRIGLAAMTTKGWGTKDCISCADRIDSLISEYEHKL